MRLMGGIVCLDGCSVIGISGLGHRTVGHGVAGLRRVLLGGVCY
jgi:hypothetical protein